MNEHGKKFSLLKKSFEIKQFQKLFSSDFFNKLKFSLMFVHVSSSSSFLLEEGGE